MSRKSCRKFYREGGFDLIGMDPLVMQDWFMEKVWANRAGLKALVVGQIVSLLLTCTGWSSSLIVRNGIYAPMAQLFLKFSLFALVYGSILIHRGKGVQIPWYWYLLLAIVEVESTFVGLKAYQYTSITSVMLLDGCSTIPCVLLLTWQFLRTRYRPTHFLGVAICMAGLVVVVFSDVHSEDRAGGGSNILFGDALVVFASTCYAALNVSEEFVVKKVDLVEFLALIGFFGMIISGCQLVAMEWKQLEGVDWNVHTVTPFLAYVLSCLAFSSLVPWLLRMNGAAMLNLSLLTSDMWAVAVRALGFHEAIDGLYFVAFGLVAVGLLVYASGGEPSHAEITPEEFLSEPDSVKYTLIEHQEEP